MEGGRPADDLSVENAIIFTASVKARQLCVENTLAGSSTSSPGSPPPHSSAPAAGEQAASPSGVPCIISPSPLPSQHRSSQRFVLRPLLQQLNQLTPQWE